MAFYEYACVPCNHIFELLRPIARMNAPAPCPRCGSKRTSKVLSLPGAVIIKDGGGDRGLNRDAQQLAGEKLRAKQGRRR